MGATLRLRVSPFDFEVQPDRPSETLQHPMSGSCGPCQNLVASLPPPPASMWVGPTGAPQLSWSGKFSLTRDACCLTDRQKCPSLLSGSLAPPRHPHPFTVTSPPASRAKPIRAGSIALALAYRCKVEKGAQIAR